MCWLEGSWRQHQLFLELIQTATIQFDLGEGRHGRHLRYDRSSRSLAIFLMDYSITKHEVSGGYMNQRFSIVPIFYLAFLLIHLYWLLTMSFCR